MISLEVPELQFVQRDLMPELDEQKKGVLDNSDVAFPKRLANGIELGVPMSQHLTAAVLAGDKQLKDFAKAKAATSDFYLIHLACTFHPLDNDPFHQAWLQVYLKSVEKGAKEGPIAWSMSPRVEGKDVKVTNEVKVGADLKLIDVVANVGVSAGGTTTTEKVNKQIFIQAFNELNSDPYWEFTRFEGAEIRGSYRFALIAQVPKGRKAVGELNAQATIKRKALGITYRTDLENAPQLTVAMP